MEQWAYLQFSWNLNPGSFTLGPKVAFSDVDWLRSWLKDNYPKAVISEPSPRKDLPESLVPYASYHVTYVVDTYLDYAINGVVSHLGAQGWEMVNQVSTRIWFKRRVTEQDAERRKVLK